MSRKSGSESNSPGFWKQLSAPWKLMLGAVATALLAVLLLSLDASYAQSSGDLQPALEKARTDIGTSLSEVEVELSTRLTQVNAAIEKGALRKLSAEGQKQALDERQKIVEFHHAITSLQEQAKNTDASQITLKLPKEMNNEEQREELMSRLNPGIRSIATRTGLRVVDDEEGFEIRSNSTSRIRGLLLLAGLALAIGAIWWRFQTPLGDTSGDRGKPARLIATGAVVMFLTYLAVQGWDSMRLLFAVATGVVLVASLIVLLPLIGRKIAISVLMLAHFLGILTAVTAVPAHGQMPWLPTYAWSQVYRPYLAFAYMNNAYHFYSPEPGPPTLVWCLIEYETDVRTDKPYRWVKLTTRDQCTTRLEYQRILALAESVNRKQVVPTAKWVALRNRRMAIALGQYTNTTDEPLSEGEYLPKKYKTELTLADYHEPEEQAKSYLASYARHVAMTYKHPTHPDLKVKYVKVYKIIQEMLEPWQINNKIDPQHPFKHQVYFMGKFTPEGVLMYPKLIVNGKVTEKHDTITWIMGTPGGPQYPHTDIAPDMYLYWRIPIVLDYRDKELKSTKTVMEAPQDFEIHDWLHEHAGRNPGGYWSEWVKRHGGNRVKKP